VIQIKTFGMRLKQDRRQMLKQIQIKNSGKIIDSEDEVDQ
jgi:hypothetical protein